MARRIAIASRDGATVHQHFGSATHFRVYDIEQNQVRLVEVRENRPSCGLEKDEGAGHARTLDLLRDCSALVVSRIGPSALRHVKERGIACYECEELVEDVLQHLASEQPE